MTLVVKPISALLTHDTQMFSNMDPYVIIQIANQKQRSKTHKQGGKKPQWSDIFRFKQVNSTKMVITVMDEDTITDDKIGTGAYDFSKQMNSGVQSREYINLTYKGRPAGKIYISICYQKPGNLGNNNNQNPYGNTNTNNNNINPYGYTNNNNINPYGYTNNNTFNNPPPPPPSFNNYNNFGPFNPPQQIAQQFAMNINNQPQQPNVGSGKQLFDIIGTSINNSNNLQQQNSGWSNNNSSQSWSNNNNNQNSGWGNQQQPPPNNGWGNQSNKNGWGNQPQSNWGSNNNGWGNFQGSNNNGW